MSRNTFALLSAFGVVAFGATTQAEYTITQGATVPSYNTTLTFDEAGTPTGVITADAFQAEYGVTIDAGDATPQVGDFDAANGGWGLGDGNSFFGNFGVFMTLDADTTEMSMDVWDPSGPPSPFGGGMGVFVFNDGVEVASFFTTPAWGGLGDTGINVVATNGDVFDEVRVLGFGFPATTYADNITWTAVSTCPADTNGDGSVNVQDLLNVIFDWQTDGSANNGDVNGDGIVDVADLIEVIVSWVFHTCE